MLTIQAAILSGSITSFSWTQITIESSCTGSTLSANDLATIVTQEGAGPTRYALPTPTTTPACDASIIYTVTVSPCLELEGSCYSDFTSTIGSSNTFELPDLEGAIE